MTETQKIKAPVTAIPRKEYAVGPVARIREQEEPEKDEHGCVVGKEEWDGEKCVPKEVTEQEEGVTSLAPVKPTEETPTEEEPEEEEPIVDAMSPTIAAPIVTEPVPEDTVLAEIKVPSPLKLDEGCRWSAQGFSSGEACVAAMQGKVDDPDAFCYGKVEETAVTETWNVYEVQKQLLESLRKIEGRSLSRDVQISKAYNVVCEALKALNSNDKALLKQLKIAVAAENKAVSKILTETVNNINKAFKSLPKDDLGWKQIKPYDDAVLQAKIVEIETKIPTAYNDAVLKETVASLEKKLTEYKADIDEFHKESIEQHQKKNELLKEQNTEIEKLKEEKTTENKKLVETVEKLSTTVDNLEHGLKGDFKGKHQPLVKETADLPTPKDPLKQEAKK